MKVDLYLNSGEKSGTMDLPDKFFDVKSNEGLVHEMLRLQLANRRYPIAKVKTKSERRGGGVKPRPQKGTGRSRQGSKRSAQWRKGGRIWGPTGEENYSLSMPKKMRRAALFGSLSDRTRDGFVFAIDELKLAEIKTKAMAGLVKKLPIDRNCLFVVPEKNEVLTKSSNNLSNIKIILVNYLNIHDILKYKKICFMKEAVSKMEEVWKS